VAHTERGTDSRGRLGAVYKAYDNKLHRVVARTQSAAGRCLEQARRPRFSREASAASALTHPTHPSRYTKWCDDKGTPLHRDGVL